MNYEIHFEKEVTSTNRILKDLSASGIPEGYVLFAESQTAGRGRLGRHFYSPPGSGLYFSILLRPRIKVSPASLTCLAAVALAEVVQSYGQKCSIKWVNDLYCDTKKAAGILTEGSFDSNGFLRYAVIGIGINLFLTDKVPSDLKELITGVFPSKEESPDPICFLNSILERINFYYEKLPVVSFWESYRKLLNCLGRKVSFISEGKEMIGTAVDLDSEFRLIVQSETGLTALDRGEIIFL